MKKRLAILVAISGLGLGIGLIAQQQSGGQISRTPIAKPNPEIIAKLREIVSIRQRLAQDEEQRIASGRASLDSAFETDLIEARIRLAREETRSDIVVAELRNLVTAQDRRLSRANALATDRLSPAIVDKMKVDLLEAQIRLLREQSP